MGTTEGLRHCGTGHESEEYLLGCLLAHLMQLLNRGLLKRTEEKKEWGEVMWLQEVAWTPPWKHGVPITAEGCAVVIPDMRPARYNSIHCLE